MRWTLKQIFQNVRYYIKEAIGVILFIPCTLYLHDLNSLLLTGKQKSQCQVNSTQTAQREGFSDLFNIPASDFWPLKSDRKKKNKEYWMEIK